MARTYDTDVVMGDGTVVKTTVASDGGAVERFLDEVRGDSGHHQALMVGIDTEWRLVDQPEGRRRAHRMAVLQLCVGRRCLVFQIVHADYVPDALHRFLASPDVRFFGVGVDGDVKRLSEDCGLEVANAVELTKLAVEALSRPELKGAGLKTLTREVMGVCIDKPKQVTMSKWDAEPLSSEQVQYACIDAFVSYEVGRLLLAGQCAEPAATSPSVATMGVQVS
ncbi:hypothetical protein ACP70R_037071 [Stipagrostis hirtigluma subsp. patula]